MKFKKKIASLMAIITLSVALLTVPVAADSRVVEDFNGVSLVADLRLYSSVYYNGAEAWTSSCSGNIDSLHVTATYYYQLGTSTYTYSLTDSESLNNATEALASIQGPLGGVAKSANSTHTAVVNGKIWTKSLSA